MRKTLSENLDGFDDSENELDVLRIYHNSRFIGLKAWAGLPNLIGFAASTDARVKQAFNAAVVRCAFSYGCYQMEVFQVQLRNCLSMHHSMGRAIPDDGHLAIRASVMLPRKLPRETNGICPPVKCANNASPAPMRGRYSESLYGYEYKQNWRRLPPPVAGAVCGR
ncbi:hypothetical protein NEMBOFW57_004109 [Staphylotrichum longicolle]|uniref:Uncharacterized protein n=1 Tax=Staphylotrichum longicolle TaxID=669026 RepID=A0AAD4I3B8_9PEZI|nr:hypothetical protein NEMBOFW57_004109 [Staphylotrichum longicolle]